MKKVVFLNFNKSGKRVPALLSLKKVCLAFCFFFLLASCTNSTDIPLTEADGTLATYLVDTATVTVTTVLLDSVATSETGVLLAGQQEDPLVGITQASAYFQVSLPNT